MNRLRSRGIVGIALLRLLTTGTGGVATVSAEQSVGVSAPVESEPRMSTEATDLALSPGTHESVPVPRLTERFEQPVDVEVTFEGPRPAPPATQGDDAHGRLGVGEQGTVMVAVDCYASSGGGAETWSVEVSATGDGVDVGTTRPVTVTCAGEG